MLLGRRQPDRYSLYIKGRLVGSSPWIESASSMATCWSSVGYLPMEDRPCKHIRRGWDNEDKYEILPIACPHCKEPMVVPDNCWWIRHDSCGRVFGWSSSQERWVKIKTEREHALPIPTEVVTHDSENCEEILNPL